MTASSKSMDVSLICPAHTMLNKSSHWHSLTQVFFWNTTLNFMTAFVQHGRWKWIAIALGRLHSQNKRHQRKGKCKEALDINLIFTKKTNFCLVLLSELKRLRIFFCFNHPIIQSSLSKALPFHLISAMQVTQVLLVSNKKHVSSWPYLFTPLDLFHFLHKKLPTSTGTLDPKDNIAYHTNLSNYNLPLRSETIYVLCLSCSFL